ncbi:hypothetical protein GP486_005915 [Trichoglossum hirsutum]|uniref:Uncharacterized protein n=1 Tax=Trichoglossum hirsutum TaxID=265104 RepID=A0A9P8RLU5_9PEZI|nr:hypothetical protein GP486_005915 [Trichoglossum hirsutum]
MDPSSELSSSTLYRTSERDFAIPNRRMPSGEQAPEIQSQYSLNIPPAAVRTKIRQEFERHRYVQRLPVVDMLIFQSNAEFQETMNYWKQSPHVLKYWRAEQDPKARLPSNFMEGFLEGRT